MVGVNFFGNFDLASLSIWLFWLFFAWLIYYLQTENMREGYPLEDEDGNLAANQGPFPLPADKTFILPHDRGEVTVPSCARHCRDDLALARTSTTGGYPLMPTGDPMVDGVGPGSWAPRRDIPELDGHGQVKIAPMASVPDFKVSFGRDPRGMPVLSKDDQVVGHVADMWIDKPEAQVRYLEIALEPEWGTGSRLVPIAFSRISRKWVEINALHSSYFDGVPQPGTAGQVTLLDEEKISAWYGGGILYS
ncbi:MAG: photosynthetic reaction center subunit H [Rhodobacteraceae bacterium]|nr:photosynthetic reaction center subunit H [Paracoccaceae bacterium]